MYPNGYPMMQPPCWCCMYHCMPMMNYPMVMPEYEFKEKKKCKKEEIKIYEHEERGYEKPHIPEKPCPPIKPIKVPVEISVPAPAPKPAQPIIIEAEQKLTNIVNIIEVEAPDIINTLIALGLTVEAARELIKAIVKASQKHNN